MTGKLRPIHRESAMKDVIDVTAKTVREHRTLRLTGGSLLGSKAQWLGWNARAWSKFAAFWLVVLGAAMAAGYLAR